ncbi:MAG: hypothetical protein F4Y71_04930 [Acidobacteria bacterium]|nr:hypothetical protein [Acidobacteriota bacterium]MXW70882.1 hypothetical protein [Acidobacteriota bacterium]MXX85781.1 hypothetical protein [Acidobacteriota bacterium]MYE44285.1 hypothetical protein [Acidobacteriota bacterium]MYG74507.1 hypothetical protein [Acidobacteriota bacterium]
MKAPARAIRPGFRAALCGIAVAAFAAGCSSPPEEVLLSQFFRALAAEDRVSAAGLSMAGFPGGPVESWEILESGMVTEGPYRVPELRQEETDAERARDEQFKIFYDFRQGNQEALARILDRRDTNPDVAIGGRLGELAAEWDAHAAERRQLVTSLSEVQMALEEERRRAQRSLLREAPVDYLAGNISEQELLVRTVEDGAAREYRFALIRYDLQNQQGAEVPARWIIAAIEPTTEDAASR